MRPGLISANGEKGKMSDDSRVQQLLDQLLDSDSSPEEVCESCPELLPIVRERCAEVCRLRADSSPGRAVLNWLWLALADQRPGKAEEACHSLNKAQAWLDQYRDGMPARADEELELHYHNWLEAHVLRREAEALIQSDASQNAATNQKRGVPQR